MSASIPADKAASPSDKPQGVADMSDAALIAEDRPLLESRHTGLLMTALMGISICQFLDLTIANVAIPHMRTSLGAGLDSITWVLTSFIIGGAVVLPLTGWLSDRWGSRNLFLAACTGFVLTSMACGAAQTLAEMVIFRALQGASSAFIGPMSQTIMFDINRPSRQITAMSIWGVVVMIAPISGPFLGGFLTEYLNWRWVFYVNLPIGIPALAILWWLLPSRPIKPRPLDVFGVSMLAIGLCALQILLDRGSHIDWFESREAVVELVIAISALWVFVVHWFYTPHPLFAREMLANGNFLIALLFMAILGVANVGLSAVLPTMYQTIYGYSVMDTGLLMAPRGFGVLTTMLVTNRLLKIMDGRYLLSLGYAIVALSMYLMTKWSLDMDRWPIVISGYVQGLGLGFVFVPVNMVAFSYLSAKFRPDGTMLMTLSRNLGSSFGISFIVTMLSRNMQTSHSDIAAHITDYSFSVFDPRSLMVQAGDAGASALAILEGEVQRQAAMIAYLDNFSMMFWLLVCVVPFGWIIKR